MAANSSACPPLRTAVALLVDTVAFDAGTEKQVAETVSRLDPSRFDVHLCCLAPSARLEELSRFCRTAVFPVESVFSPGGAWQILRFRRYLRRHGIRVVHAFMTRTAIFGVLAAGCSRRRAVVTSRLSTGYWYTPAYLRLFRYLNRRTTRVFANSEAVKRIAVEAEGLDPKKVEVIYNGVDLPRYAAGRGDPALPLSLGIPPGAAVVGMVANLRPVKDIPLFLHAAKIVARECPETAFVIVGQGPLSAELRALAHALGISGSVFFSEGRGAVPDFLARMCVGCLSSQSEGFSNAILEYMAAALPVVATDVGGNAEAIEDRVTGFLVRERTPQAFAAPIIELLRDPDRRALMGRRSLERCRALFDMAGYVRRMESFYCSLSQLHATESRR